MSQLPAQIGRYQILGRLGAGGMAEILVARLVGEGGFERPLVLKRILPEKAGHPEFVRMFVEEARMAGQVRHQNVVQIFELVHDQGELYLVMEYLEGESAAAVARRLASTRKLLAFGLAAHVVAEVCAGLRAAHELIDADDRPTPLVHRDISPGNIHLSYDGQVKILDFGIAAPAGTVPSRRELKGKLAYLSPEQVRSHPLDRRSDLFSLGAVLYELSTCRRLFKRPTDQETLDAILTEPIVPPSRLVADYPRELERIVLKALERNPDDRYATAIEMRRDLLAVAAQLNQGKVPEDSLGKVMQKLFADRRAERRALLKVSPEDPRFGEPPQTDPLLDIPDPAMLAALAGQSSLVSANSAIASTVPTPIVATPAVDPVAPPPLPEPTPDLPSPSQDLPEAEIAPTPDLPTPAVSPGEDLATEVELVRPASKILVPSPTPEDPASTTPLPQLVSEKKRQWVGIAFVVALAILIFIVMRF